MNRIKILREEFNYTQQDLANKLECSKSVIGLYENETRKPSLDVLIKLSEIFNCSIDFLIGKSDNKNLENTKNNIKYEFDLKDYDLNENELSDLKSKIEEFAEFQINKIIKNREKK